MFKRKRKSDPKILSKDTADGTSRSDFLEPESDVLQDVGSPRIPNTDEKKKKKKVEAKPKPLTKTKETTPMQDGNNFEERGTTDENLVRNDTKFESLCGEEKSEAESLPADSWGETNSDQETMKKYDPMKINEEEQRDTSGKWSQCRNQSSVNGHFKGDDTNVKNQGVQSKNFNSSGLASPEECCAASEAGESDSKEYQSFLRGLDRATGSTVIQSEDSYEKLRYSRPRIKRFKEVTVGPELWNAKRTLFHEWKEPGKRSATRDMETRNSDDIITGGNSKNQRLMHSGNSIRGKNRTDDHLHPPEDREGSLHKYYGVCSTTENNEASGLNPTEKTPRHELMNVPNSTSSPDSDHIRPKKMLIYRDAEAQTKAPTSSATEIATCCSLEGIRSLEKSLLRFLSESRLTMTPQKDDNQSSATGEKMAPEKINPHVFVTNAGCDHILGVRSPVNNFSTKKTEYFRKPCRCGNGCGTEDKSTCCCKRN